MDKFKEKALNDKGYMRLVRDIINSEQYRVIDKYPHHNEYTRLDHCLHVSYSAYLFFKKHEPGYRFLREACRGALLHDYFLYEWHTENPFPVPCMHAWKHPEWAYKDAKKHFKLNPVERDVILKHMYPVTPIPPLTKAAWTVVMFDKYWALREGLTTFNLIEFMKLQVPAALRKKK